MGSKLVNHDAEDESMARNIPRGRKAALKAELAAQREELAKCRLDTT